MAYKRTAIIGIGLIGGSFALAAKRAGSIETVVGVARSDETLQAALEIGAADEVTTDPAEAVRGADLIYIAVPVGATRGVFEQIRDSLESGALVTDAGSTKREVMQAAAELLPDHVSFIGGHPMAGSEQSGVRAARADLFEGAAYYITPSETTTQDQLDHMLALVRALGARPDVKVAEYHDRLMAATSHLPHLVAAALAGTIHRLASGHKELGNFLGAGFTDTTRLAEGSPEVWRDILLSNPDNVAAALDEMIQQLQQFAAAFQETDRQTFDRLLEGARQARRELLEQQRRELLDNQRWDVQNQ